MNDAIFKIYNEIKGIFKEHKETKAVSNLFLSLYYECESLLETKKKMLLNSQIANKTYFSYKENKKLTRPINTNLYDSVSPDRVNAFKK